MGKTIVKGMICQFVMIVMYAMLLEVSADAIPISSADVVTLKLDILNMPEISPKFLSIQYPFKGGESSINALIIEQRQDIMQWYGLPPANSLAFNAQKRYNYWNCTFSGRTNSCNTINMFI